MLPVDEHHDEHLHQQLEDWDAAPPALDGLEWRHGDDLRGGKKGNRRLVGTRDAPRESSA